MVAVVVVVVVVVVGRSVVVVVVVVVRSRSRASPGRMNGSGGWVRLNCSVFLGPQWR